MNEIKVWKDLDHPNIIKYYTSFIEKDNVYIVMELVEGMNLAEYLINLKEKVILIKKYNKFKYNLIKGSKTKDKDIIKIIIDILCALKYLHNEKHIHYRDANPHNIMLDNNFNVKLGDFGLAKKFSKEGEISNNINSAFQGSILYSSPEVVNNQQYTDKSDIWSFGCIIYELISSTPPFSGDNLLTVASNIASLNYKKLTNECNPVS